MLLTPEDKLILASVKINPNKEELEGLNDLITQITDWNFLINNIIERGIAPLFYKKHKFLSNQNLIPTFATRKLKSVYYTTLHRSLLMYESFKIILNAFNSQNIQVVALKGIFLSESLYKDIGLRQFSDIDLLVREEDGKKCLEILEELGYETYYDELNEYLWIEGELVHYQARILNDVSVEIHIKLNHITEKYNLEINEIWKNIVPVKIFNLDLNVLEFNHMLIHLCVHLDRHLRIGHVQFTSFCDIVNILDIYSTNIDWNSFIMACDKFNCKDEVFKNIILVNKYFAAYIPKEVLRKYKPLLLEKDEELFVKYLKGISQRKESVSGVPQHLDMLKSISQFSELITYLKRIIFPSKSFMIEKYGLVGSSPVTRDVEILHKQQEVIGKYHHPKENFKLQIVAKWTSRFGGTTNYKLIFWWLWYPYRWWVGVKGLISLLRSRY